VKVKARANMQATRRDPLKGARETITFAALFTLTVHGFIAHMKMHPELLPAGMTAFDLERFRKLCSGTDQAGIDQWVEQCSRRTHEQRS